MTSRGRVVVLLAVAAATAVVALLLPPLPQPTSYHHFADQRRLLGLPHALNVLSNFAFVLVGGWGLWVLLGRSPAPLATRGERLAWVVFMSSVVLTGLGSGYYHLAPADGPLFWDRLPMALGFAALLAIVIGERVSPRWGARLLAPLLVVGAASLLGHPHDLRGYALLQALTVVLVPLMLALFPARYTGTRAMVAALLLYVLAAALDRGDALFFRAGGVVSGHTLKHLVAAAAAAGLVLLLRRRRPREAGAA